MGLTREGVVRAALELLDDVGVDGLTLRALAGRLDVKAPALYWHVKSKQDLLDEMGTEFWRRVQGKLAEMPAEAAWDEQMRLFADILRRSLLAHRDGAKVFSGTYLTDAGLLENQEQGLVQWKAQGFALADVIGGFALLYNAVIGFCIEEQAVRAAPERYTPESRVARLDADQFPNVAASNPFGDADANFDRMVGLVVIAVGTTRHPA